MLVNHWPACVVAKGRRKASAMGGRGAVSIPAAKVWASNQ